MSLIRISEKKLAANRANAKKSRGPATSQGKSRSSQNACKHHLYARKFTIHPEWRARIWAVVRPAAACVENPLERARLTRYLFLMQWIEELAAYETRLLRHSIARHRGDLYRGTHHFVTTNPLFLVISTRINTLNRHANRARIDWECAQRATSQEQTIPNLSQSKPLTMTAAAGSCPPAPQFGPHTPLQPQFIRRRFAPRTPSTTGPPPARPPTPRPAPYTEKFRAS